MPEAKKPRVLWLTNLPAPYRFPIWDHLSKTVDLTVVFVLKEKNWRNWRAPEQSKWKYRFLSLNSLQIKEYDIIPSARGAKRILEDTDIAIVGGWESPIYIRTILLAKKFRIPVIQIYESFTDSHRFKSGPVALIRKCILEKADKLVTISHRSTQTLIRMGIDSSRITTLFNPVDVNWYSEYARSYRRQFKPGHRFLFVGQLIQRKNILTTIRAFASIAQNYDSLVIAGQGPLQPQIKDLISELELTKSVHLVGHKSRESLAKLYASSHSLLLPSTNEVWGLVANEALATGMHVIVSEVSGVSEFISKMNGVYICATDESSLAKSMIQSRQDYSGPIKNPTILNFTPEKFADLLSGEFLNLGG